MLQFDDVVQNERPLEQVRRPIQRIIRSTMLPTCYLHATPRRNKRILVDSNTNKRANMRNMNSTYRNPTPQRISHEMISTLMRRCDLDTSFDAASFSSPPASWTSSYSSYSSGESSASSCISKSQKGGLSRSRCVGNNLSALGGIASETSIKRCQVPKSKPNEGWGYFVDTPDEKR